jgi:hypothetical protein
MIRPCLLEIRLARPSAGLNKKALRMLRLITLSYASKDVSQLEPPKKCRHC